MPRKHQAKPVVEPFGTGRATQAPAAPTGGAYGEHKALIDAQQAIALPGPALNPGRPAGAPAAAAQPAAPTPAGAPPGPMPGPLAAMQGMVPPTPLTAPTARPDEPVTAGLGGAMLPPVGGPPAPAPTGPDPRAKLEALYQVAPSADLADLIQHLDA